MWACEHSEQRMKDRGDVLNGRKGYGVGEVVDGQATTPDLAKSSEHEQLVEQRRHIGHEGR